MTGLEGPAAGWLLTKLGAIARRLKRWVARDHLPITGRQGRPDQHYAAFFVFAAVAPSRSPKPLPLVDFADRARELVEEAFPETSHPSLTTAGASSSGTGVLWRECSPQRTRSPSTPRAWSSCSGSSPHPRSRRFRSLTPLPRLGDSIGPCRAVRSRT